MGHAQAAQKIIPHKEDILVESPAIVSAHAIGYYTILLFAAFNNLRPEVHSSSDLIMVSIVSIISSTLALIAVLKFARSHYIACLIVGAAVSPFAALLGVSILYGLNYNAHVLIVLWFPIGMSMMLGLRGLVISLVSLLADFGLLYVLDMTTSLFPHYATLSAANVRHEVESSLIISALLICTQLCYSIVLLRRTIDTYKKKANDATARETATVNLMAEVEHRAAEAERQAAEAKCRAAEAERRAAEAEQRLHDIEFQRTEIEAKTVQIVA